MEYIKHDGNFYKKIDLKELDKKELIKLITEAIELNPKIVERWSTYPVYIDRIKPIIPDYPYNITWCQSNLNNFST